MMKIGKYLKNIWLCLKYPFLYPRNRFTGLHYNNWEITKYIEEHSKKAYLNIITHFTTEKPDCDSLYNYIPEYGFIKLELHGDEIYLIHGKPGGILEKIIHKIKINQKVLGISWKTRDIISVWVNKKPSKNRLNLHKITLFPWDSFKIKFLRFIHNWVLQIFHCIPSYTELDALEKGWRKKFGENICKEIRKSLLKSGGLKSLFRYRITQIKEKWGYLHWYDCGSTEEIFDIIQKYEDISSHTCIHCGKPATYRSRGWISPYCDDHIGNKDNADKIEEGH